MEDLIRAHWSLLLLQEFSVNWSPSDILHFFNSNIFQRLEYCQEWGRTQFSRFLDHKTHTRFCYFPSLWITQFIKVFHIRQYRFSGQKQTKRRHIVQFYFRNRLKKGHSSYFSPRKVSLYSFHRSILEIWRDLELESSALNFPVFRPIKWEFHQNGRNIFPRSWTSDWRDWNLSVSREFLVQKVDRRHNDSKNTYSFSLSTDSGKEYFSPYIDFEIWFPRDMGHLFRPYNEV